MEKQIFILINKAIADLNVSKQDLPVFTLEHPDEIKHGDWATNIALVLAKQLKKTPLQIANEITKILNNNLPKEIIKVEVAGPGFINFYLSSNYFIKEIKKILKTKEKYGQADLPFIKKIFKTKIIIEHSDPNPFKEFHIGHLMSNSIGESISRIVKFLGVKVIPVSYGGDVGLHVAKAIYAVLKYKDKISVIRKLDTQKQLAFWADMYVEGSNAYEEKLEAKIEIDNLNKIIFDKSDPYINDLYFWGREISIFHFQKIFKRLNSHFEHNFWESEVIPDALLAVKEGLAKNILENSDGAVVFKGEKHGLHTRVFINSKGVPTYEAKELGLGVKKIKQYNFDSSIIITGNEQDDYFRVLLKVMELLRPKVKDKTTHIGHGMLRFASGKMSSRKGNIITGVSLLDKVKENILEKMQTRDFSDNEKEEISEIIALGAVKYSILRQIPTSDIIFDLDKSISFDGDSGPYLQYSCVRANSILEKAKQLALKANPNPVLESSDLEKLLVRFGEVVKRAGKEYSPHYLTTYLVQLAGAFNTFYSQEIIVNKNNPNSSHKIFITQSFFVVMNCGLNLLGINVPKKM